MYHVQSETEKFTSFVKHDYSDCIISVTQPGRIIFSVAAINQAGVGDYCSPVEAVVPKHSHSIVFNSPNIGACSCASI